MGSPTSVLREQFRERSIGDRPRRPAVSLPGKDLFACRERENESYCLGLTTLQQRDLQRWADGNIQVAVESM